MQIALQNGNGTLTNTIVVQNVFSPEQSFLVDCPQKPHQTTFGDSGPENFCDELMVLPPGVYEIKVQSQDTSCKTELDHYKVVVEENKTTEVVITMICQSSSGGLDTIVTEEHQPGITDINFNFLSGLEANKFICQCSEDVTLEVAVADPDTACTGLTPSWSVVNSSGVDVTAALLSDPQMISGDPCRFTVVVDSTVALGDYVVTFGVSDGTTPLSTISFPLHLIDCGNLCQGCPTGTYLCGNACVDLLNDSNNCGTCGNECGVGQTCNLGVCSGGCPAGQTDCNGTCTNLLTDMNNCGACGNACDADAGAACINGLCTTGCPVGQTDCSGTCVDLQTDMNNCGACGNACGAGLTCVGGDCVGTCVGEAATFAILGLNNGTVSINSANTVYGDIGYSLGVASTINQKIGGGTVPDIWVGGAYVHSDVLAFGYEYKNYLPSDGIMFDSTADTRLDQANASALAAAAAFSGLTPDVTLGAVTTNQTITSTQDVTVISMSSLTYNSNVLELDGRVGFDDAFIIQVTGDFSFAQSEISLVNVRSERVVWVFPNASNITINKDASIFNGTILAPTSYVLYHNPATFNGAIIAQNIDLHSDFNLSLHGLDLLCPPYP